MPRSTDVPSRRRPRGALLAALIGLGVSCGDPGDGTRIAGGAAAERATGSVLVLVAASASDATETLAREFEASTGVAVRVASGASSALAAQVAAGSPAALFLSAHPRWAADIERLGLAAEVTPLLSNALVLVVPRDRRGVAAPADLAGPGVRRVALAGEGVPAGQYGEQALRHAGVFDALHASGQVVRGADVRHALAFVAAGEADAGVVYATDARAEPRVVAVHRFADGTHEQVAYPLVRLAVAGETDAAQRFAAYLRGARGRAVFEAHGFSWAAR